MGLSFSMILYFLSFLVVSLDQGIIDRLFASDYLIINAFFSQFQSDIKTHTQRFERIEIKDQKTKDIYNI